MTAPPKEVLDPLLYAANALRAAGQHAEALAAFAALRAIAPGDIRIRAAEAVALFCAGRWDDAWRAYDMRFERMGGVPRMRRIVDGAPQALPRWTEGAPPADILVRAEQGMGDTVQFARYLPLLRGRVRRLRFEASPRIHRLLRPLTEGIELLGRQPTLAELADCDAWVPLLDLPARLGITPRADPDAKPYLRAEPDRIARWRDRLAGVQGLRVGIVWQGNPNAPVDANRSMPLAAMMPLAHVPGARLVSLQKGPGEEQVAQVAFRESIHTLGPEFDPGEDMFLDTAAVLATLDVLVTVDTGVAHVAGAMGVPTLLLIHGNASDWRWLQGREDTVWYPSVRLIRCEGGADWMSAAAKAAAMLRARLATGPGAPLPPPGPVAERRERGNAEGPGIATALPVAEALDLLGGLAAIADGTDDPGIKAGLHRRLDALQAAVAAARPAPGALDYVLALRDAHRLFARAERALRSAPPDGKAEAAAALLAAQERRAGLLRAAATLPLGTP